MDIPRESAGGIIVNPEGRIALVEQHGNSWSFPKGGVEAGEDLLSAAKREIFEETGLQDLELAGNLGSYERYSISRDGKSENQDWGKRRRTLFLFTSAQQDFGIGPHDEEITAARWVTVDEALGLLTHPKDKEFLLSVRNAIEKAPHV